MNKGRRQLSVIRKFRSSFFAFGLLAFALSCNHKDANRNSTIEVIEEFSELEAIIETEEDRVVVVNFWATSCPPCIKEMPHFNRLESEYGDRGVRIVLVSLDAVKDLQSRVYPFVKKHQITPEVVLLGDENYSGWTGKIDASWYGALPATVIYAKSDKLFRFGMYESYEDLLADVDR